MAKFLPLAVLLDLKADCWSNFRQGVRVNVATECYRKDENDLIFIIGKLSTSQRPPQLNKEQCKHVVKYEFWKTFTRLHRGADGQLQSLGLQCGERLSPRSMMARDRAEWAGQTGYMTADGQRYGSGEWQERKHDINPEHYERSNGGTTVSDDSTSTNTSTSTSSSGGSGHSTPRSGVARQLQGGASSDSSSPRGRLARQGMTLLDINGLNLRQGPSR